VGKGAERAVPTRFDFAIAAERRARFIVLVRDET
jgi:hypothetical protein